MISQLLKHTSNYTMGNGLLILAGLVSFPILTRLLSVDEYGLMSLVATLLTLIVGIAKLGMQHATLRFFSEVQAGRRDVGMDGFVATVMWGMGGVGLLATLLWALGAQIAPASWFNDERLRPLLLWTSCLIFVRVVDSALVNQLRAQERSGVLMIYSVTRRYASLGLMLGVMFGIAANVWGFYAAIIVGEAVATLSMAVWMFHRHLPRPSAFSSPLFRTMLAFGVPMIGYELSSIALSMGDRYIIQRMLGSEALGVYSAAYNLCDYIKLMLMASLVGAVQPIYMRYWEREGAEVTAKFLGRFMHLYAMVAMLVIAGMAAVGEPMIGFLASEKYAEGATVIPFLIAAMAIDVVVVVTGAGLYIHKRTKTIMLLVLTSAAINVGLNLLLIPVIGLRGPAVAMLVSYLLLMLAGATLGRDALRIPMPFAAVLKFGAIAAVMYVMVMAIDLGGHFATLLARSAAGLAIYAALALVADREARGGLQWLRARVAARRATKSTKGQVLDE